MPNNFSEQNENYERDSTWSAIGNVTSIQPSDKYSKILLRRKFSRGPNKTYEDNCEITCFSDSLAKAAVEIGDKIKAECYVTSKEGDFNGKPYRRYNVFAFKIINLHPNKKQPAQSSFGGYGGHRR